MAKRRCAKCHRNIKGLSHRAYCSDECATNRRCLKCNTCGVKLPLRGSLIPGKTWSKYCSEACQQVVDDWCQAVQMDRVREARLSDPNRRTCATCGKTIFGRQRSPWCSNACSPEIDEHGRHRHTDRYTNSQLALRFPQVMAEAAMLKALVQGRPISGSISDV